ncbi:MAG: hypothetical protein H6Q14_997 [Bacteroidetes bacterium]|nr:hypothetical protein [Bacteroidota bacterium]
MKQDLSDITFLIPVRLDSIIRLENLILSVGYLKKHFRTNILIFEASEYNNHFIEKLLGKEVKYYFHEDHDPVFYRTRYLNWMVDMATTSYLGIWDSDVIVPKQQILDSISQLRNGFVDMIYPFDGHFYDTSEPVRELYLRKRNIKTLSSNIYKMELIYGDRAVGGAFMVNKLAYIESGKENERFYGWGPEDGERFHRWKNLGKIVEFSTGNLYHLSHPRGINSGIRSANQRINTQRELILIQQSSKEEIIKSLNNVEQHC